MVLPELYFTPPRLVSLKRSCLGCFPHRFRTLQRLLYVTIEDRIVKLAESLNRLSASLYFGGSSSRARSVAAEVVHWRISPKRSPGTHNRVQMKVAVRADAQPLGFIPSGIGLPRRSYAAQNIPGGILQLLQLFLHGTEPSQGYEDSPVYSFQHSVMGRGRNVWPGSHLEITFRQYQLSALQAPSVIFKFVRCPFTP